MKRTTFGGIVYAAGGGLAALPGTDLARWVNDVSDRTLRRWAERRLVELRGSGVVLTRRGYREVSR